MLHDRMYNAASVRQYVNNKVVPENVSFESIQREYSDALAQQLFAGSVEYVYKAHDCFVLSRDRGYLFVSRYGKGAEPRDMKDKVNMDKLVSFVLSEVALLTSYRPTLLPVINMVAPYSSIAPLLSRPVAHKLPFKGDDIVSIHMKERFHQYAILANYFKSKPLTPIVVRSLIFLVVFYLRLLHQHYPQFAHKDLVCNNIYLYANADAQHYVTADASYRLSTPFNIKFVHFYRAQLYGASKQSYDLYTFLRSLTSDLYTQWRSDVDLVQFIQDVIGRDTMDTSVAFDQYDNVITSDEILQHRYFAPFVTNMNTNTNANNAMEMSGGGCGCASKSPQKMLGGKRKKVVARFESHRRELEQELHKLRERVEKDTREIERIRKMLGEIVEDVPPQVAPPMNKMAQFLNVQPSEQSAMQNTVMQHPYYQQMYYPMMHPPNPYVPVDEMSLMERQLYAPMEVEKKNNL